ncbi:MAG: HEAT repeat domain-containing protein, partial [Pseudomonadota bacterium]|nr:HEAT repeat domain-containing protein [Pseudomonadota bacterium]
AQMRAKILGALGKIAPQADSTLQILMAGLQDKQAVVRTQAAEEFRFLATSNGITLSDPEVKAILPGLITALKDDHEDVRRKAIWAIGGIGPRAKNALPQVMEAAVNDSHVPVREYALWTMEKIAPQDPLLAKALIAGLKDQEPSVRKRAAETLILLESPAKEAVPQLIAAAQDQQVEVALKAIWALGKIGPEAKDAVPLLMDMLEQSDARQWYAAWSLGKIGKAAEAATPALIRILKDEKTEQRPRSEAIEALEKIRPATPSAISQLKAFAETRLRDNDAWITHELRLRAGRLVAALESGVQR